MTRRTEDISFTDEQLTAIGRREGSILVAAGAGTGKTSVLVERFVRAVLEDGVEVESMLAITFTEKAAAQLTRRIRKRFTERDAPDRARESEGAWISTIHGFCARVLRTHALTAGLDPGFGVLDALESERVAIDAFDRALGDFVSGADDPERIRLLASYTPDKLADMVRTVYGHLRSRGEGRPRLPEIRRPQPAGEREALLDAARAAAAEIGGVEGKQVGVAHDMLGHCTDLLERLGPGALAEPHETGGLALKGSANALKGRACQAYREAQEAYAALCAADQAYRDHVLLRLLVDGYGGHYARLKRDRSGLDFDDLELRARDLLRDHAGVRQGYAERFSHLMIDEFQDTNPLQNEILALLERDNLFRVGDERQSIYRFRHADVGVFRDHRDAARESGALERITVNFRSRPGVLDAVDLAFSELWGPEFEALEAPGAPDAPDGIGIHADPVGDTATGDEPVVELLLADRDKKRWDERFAAEIEHGREPFGDAMRGITPWRAAEARLMAKRIAELIARGLFEPGECVVLLRATTSIGIYERALEERGVPTYVLGGRGYWSQQQVGDLRAYLSALANPLDELALYSVLASPLGGVSLDALVVVSTAAKRARWDVWRTVQALADPGSPGEEVRETAAALEARDAKRLSTFVVRFRAERAAAPRVALETLIDRAVTGSGYDRVVLAMPQGDRRMANVRKLMRMARQYEADEGRDVRGFIDFVAERDLVQEREGQAALDAEDLDAVKLMTVHRAKGLEFPLVCVADLGKLGREDDSALRVSEDGETGLRLASMGGAGVDTEALARMKERQRLEDEEEERRILYVAATRAERHLILSGATDLEKLPQPEAMAEPARWVWRNLGVDPSPAGPLTQCEGSWEGRPVRVRTEVVGPANVDELLSEPDRRPVATEPDPAGLEALAAPALSAVPVPAALPISRLSYSGLEAYRRCGYRFYLERALKLPRPDDAPAAGGRAAAPYEMGMDAPLVEGVPEMGMTGVVRGSVVHALLEDLDFGAPAPPSPESVAAAIEAADRAVRAEEVQEVRELIASFADSDLARRIAGAARVRAELPFAFTLNTGGGRSLLIDGIVDVHAQEDDGTVLVVDYKTDRLDGADPADRLAGSYSTQQLVYALAALRSGAPRAEVVYSFLERPAEPVAAVYTASEISVLEDRLRDLAAGVSAAIFTPTDSPHRGLCADCPGRPALCSWDEEQTLAADPSLSV
ncbi:MAG: UvrD-helicase domain-containing protein [Thermoleophilaceae bacterium]